MRMRCIPLWTAKLLLFLPSFPYPLAQGQPLQNKINGGKKTTTLQRDLLYGVISVPAFLDSNPPRQSTAPHLTHVIFWYHQSTESKEPLFFFQIDSLFCLSGYFVFVLICLFCLLVASFFLSLFFFSLLRFYGNKVFLCGPGCAGTLSRPGWPQTQRCTGLWLPSAAVKDVCHHAWPPSNFFIPSRFLESRSSIITHLLVFLRSVSQTWNWFHYQEFWVLASELSSPSCSL